MCAAVLGWKVLADTECLRIKATRSPPIEYWPWDVRSHTRTVPRVPFSPQGAASVDLNLRRITRHALITAAASNTLRAQCPTVWIRMAWLNMTVVFRGSHAIRDAVSNASGQAAGKWRQKRKAGDVLSGREAAATSAIASPSSKARIAMSSTWKGDPYSGGKAQYAMDIVPSSKCY